MKRSSITEVNEPSLSDCGWDHEGNIIGIEEAYPSSIERLRAITKVIKKVIKKVTKKTWTSTLEKIA